MRPSPNPAPVRLLLREYRHWESWRKGLVVGELTEINEKSSAAVERYDHLMEELTRLAHVAPIIAPSEAVGVLEKHSEFLEAKTRQPDQDSVESAEAELNAIDQLVGQMILIARTDLGIENKP